MIEVFHSLQEVCDPVKTSANIFIARLEQVMPD